MIEKDLLEYLQAQPSITTPLGGVNKIVVAQAPVDPNFKLPWMVIEVSSGTRKQITAGIIDETIQARITIDCGYKQTVLGRTIAETVMRSLDHIRGQFGDKSNCYITCSTIRSYAGVLSVTRYQFDCRISWTEPFSKPS